MGSRCFCSQTGFSYNNNNNSLEQNIIVTILVGCFSSTSPFFGALISNCTFNMNFTNNPTPSPPSCPSKKEQRNRYLFDVFVMIVLIIALLLLSRDHCVLFIFRRKVFCSVYNSTWYAQNTTFNFWEMLEGHNNVNPICVFYLSSPYLPVHGG